MAMVLIFRVSGAPWGQRGLIDEYFILVNHEYLSRFSRDEWWKRKNDTCLTRFIRNKNDFDNTFLRFKTKIVTLLKIRIKDFFVETWFLYCLNVFIWSLFFFLVCVLNHIEKISLEKSTKRWLQANYLLLYLYLTSRK